MTEETAATQTVTIASNSNIMITTLSCKNCSKTKTVELISISFATLFLACFIFVAIISSIPYPNIFGLVNATYDVQPEGQYAPTFWVFPLAAFIIFSTHIVWIVYGWTYIFRPNAVRPIFWITYVISCITSSFGVCWFYVWGNGYDKYSYPVLFFYGVSVYSLFITQIVYFYRTRIRIKSKKDKCLTRLFVTNGLLLYTGWLTGANLFAITGLISRHSTFGKENSATLFLSIVTVGYIVYYIVEATILDRFLRYAISIYPFAVLILYGIVQRNCLDKKDKGGTQSTCIFSSIMLAFSVFFFALRILLLGIFIRYRPLPRNNHNYQAFTEETNSNITVV